MVVGSRSHLGLISLPLAVQVFVDFGCDSSFWQIHYDSIHQQPCKGPVLVRNGWFAWAQEMMFDFTHQVSQTDREFPTKAVTFLLVNMSWLMNVSWNMLQNIEKPANKRAVLV